MQKDEGLSTRLWLEERENELQNNHDPVVPQSLTFSLTKTQLDLVNDFLKKYRRSWDDVVYSAWGLLLNRISTASSITFGVTSADIKHKHPLLTQPIRLIHSKIDDTMTVKLFLDSIKKQASIKHNKKDDDINDARYLCLGEKTIHSKSAKKLDIEHFTLAICSKAREYGKFTFIYHPGYFQKDNIKKIKDHFIIILTNICQDLKRKVIDIEIMSTAEKNRILHDWSNPVYSCTSDHTKKCTHDMIADYARAHPDQLAISHNDIAMSFAELDQHAERLAQVFIESGIKPQENIAVLMERTSSLIIAMLAIFKAGAIFVPINPKYPNERIEYVIEDSAATRILVNHADKLPEKFKNQILVIPEAWHALPALAKQVRMPVSSPSQVAYIIYTSGTTGKPKGVMINHDNLFNLAAWYLDFYKINANDRSSQFASQGFDTFLCETMPILACGASVHIVDETIKLTPNLFFDWLQKEKITICDLPTAYAQMLLSLQWPNVDLRFIKIGGETCTRYPTQQYTFDIWNCYGPTETTIEATYYKMYSANQDSDKVLKYKTPSIGKIIANGQVYVVDSYLQPVPAGVAGELLIGGECVSPGYYNRDELTQAKFIDNTFSQTTMQKLYRTGDLVSWLPDGNLAFIGRIDNQIKVRGYRIELGAIESIISQYSDVREVAVIAKETPNGDKTIVAYVSPNIDKERFLFQERCLLSIDDTHFIESITEDISKYGIALSGVTENFYCGKKVKLHLKLPGFNTSKDISARIIWQLGNRCGLIFDSSPQELEIIAKCIDHFLSTHNIMDLVLSASAKRSLRKALKRKLPEYMVPSTFVTLLEFPLTFSGKVDLKALPPPDEYEQILRKHFVAPSTETEKKVTAIWQSLLSREHIGMEDNFFDLGGNSMKAAELSVSIMDAFGISVPANILFDLPYIPILSEYVESKGVNYTTQTLIQDDIERDRILPENIVPTGHLSKIIHNPENVLLTGAGGFLGIFMLNELLTATNAKIHCLLRKGEFESAAKRMDATIKKFQLSNNISLSNRRIIAIPSDLSLDQFGIPNEQYKNIAQKVDIIYHCGAQVNIMASYNHLRGSNVQGTHEIIKFATYLRDKPIHYISTLSSAYLKDESGSLTEEFPTEQYTDLFGGYAISKWVSERLLTELKDRGLPVTIYRSGYISGHSQTGVTSLNDALLMLIKGCIELGYAPDMNERITILPVDFVSKSVIKLSMTTPEQSLVYHLDHPTGIMWPDLVAWLNDYGYDIKIITLEAWKNMLLKIQQDNALYPFLPYYLALPNDYNSPGIRTEKAASALQKVGLTYPEINNDLLNMYFDHLCVAGFLSQPSKKKTIV